MKNHLYNNITKHDMITHILMILFYVINIIKCVVIPFCKKLPNIEKHDLAELLSGVIGMMFLSVCFMALCKTLFTIIDKLRRIIGVYLHTMLYMLLLTFLSYAIISYSVDDIFA